MLSIIRLAFVLMSPTPEPNIATFYCQVFNYRVIIEILMKEFRFDPSGTEITWQYKLSTYYDLYNFELFQSYKTLYWIIRKEQMFLFFTSSTWKWKKLKELVALKVQRTMQANFTWKIVRIIVHIEDSEARDNLNAFSIL